MFAIYEGSMGITAKNMIREGFSTLEEAKNAFTALMSECGHEIADLEKDDENDAYDALVIRRGGMDTATYTIEKI